MKSEKNILVAFLLNLAFSIFELVGGLLTGSVAILSDALHDVGDAAGIGLSFYMERKSKKQPDQRYTYGYGRYSVLGGLITTFILLLGSVAVLINAIRRLINPVPIHYDGMILLAVVGVLVNAGAAFLTREGDSLNQKAVNLHMLEDVLGWAVVLVGAVVMRFTDLTLLDPLLSMGVAVFILVNAIKNLREALPLLLERAPEGISVEEISHHLREIGGIKDVHHLHLWSLDGVNHYATLHVATRENPHRIKEAVRKELAEHGICHVTVEIEAEGEPCEATVCHVEASHHSGHHHHGGHHHH